MIGMPDRFQTKLYLVVVGFIVIIALLAGVFYASAAQYKYHLERSELAHTVLIGYLTVSDHTYRKLSAMGEIVEQGRIGDHQQRLDNQRSLRNSLSGVRRSIAAELAFVRDEMEAEELEHLHEIEQIVDEILRVSVDIRESVDADNAAAATAALSALRSDAIAGRFSQLIDMALDEERREVAAAREAANRLDQLITTVLPASIIGILMIGMFLAVAISRRLARSVYALVDAASAYTAGEFGYRIEELREREFARLREAMHRMADDLLARQAAAEQDKASLESLVKERTKELEKSNAQLEQIDRSRRQFLSDISHELRTPLTVIQGESELCLRGGTKSTEEYQDALKRVREQAVHTNRLVDDLLFVARAEEGQPRLKKQSISLVSLLRTVCSDFRFAAERKCVSITEEHTDDRIVVSGDSDRLHQVFAILLDNALRYSEEGGSIHVTVEKGADGAVVDVKDNGIGLSEEDARQAFHRFYRGANAERQSNGIGLGLPVAKAIVEAHGGYISLTGNPGEGAVARVTLPVEREIRAIA